MGMVANFLKVKEKELNAFIENSELLEERIYDEMIGSDVDYLDIDKSWDGILFLLIGKGMNTSEGNEPFLKVIFSGQFIDETQNLGFGPAHLLFPKEVKELSLQLLNLDRKDLKARFNPTKMEEMEVYPTIWSENDFEYLSEHFESLKSFYKSAAENDMAIISIVN